MTLWLNDIEEGAIVSLPITTHVAAGANVAPSSAFEIDDIRVYKGASATQRASTAGMSLVSPFDSLTGVHMLEIDCSDNTDAGFWAAGNMYHVMLVPDETVDGQAIAVHVASFGIAHGLVASVNTLLATVLSRMGTPTNLGSGATLADNLTNIYDVADAVESTIGVAGAGLTAITNTLGTDGDGLSAIPWNPGWDAEVQSEANDALVANGLDHLLAASVTGTDVTDNSIIAKIVSKSATADWDSFVNTTDALEAQRDNVGTASNLGGGATIAANLSDIEGQTDDIGAAGAGLTALATASSLTTVSTNVDTVLTRLGTPSNLGSGATLAGNAVDIESQTDDIGTAGAGLTAITGRLPAALVSGRMDASVGAMAASVLTAAAVATGAIDADALAADAVDEILDEVVEGSTTLRQALRLLLSVLGAISNGGGTTTINFRDLANTKNRVAATVDSSGNRSAVTLDLT